MDGTPSNGTDHMSQVESQHENLFVIFPIGAGGNHLANLLSLSTKYERQVDFAHYADLSTTTAHFSDALNLTNLTDRICDLRNQSNVFCSHLAEYIWHQDLVKQNFQRRKFLIINTHGAHEWIRYRMTQFNPGLVNEYVWQETATLYSQAVFASLTGENDFFNIDINNLFDCEPNSFVDFLEQMLLIKIPRELACEVHQKWQNANYMSTLSRRAA